MNKTALYAILLIAIAMYGVSLTLPSLWVSTLGNKTSARSNCERYQPNIPLEQCIAEQMKPRDLHLYGTGLDMLINGWIGIFAGMFAWYANVLFFVALIFSLLKKYKHAVISAGLGVLIGLQAFMVRTYPANEAGGIGYIDHFDTGYYIWMASLVALAIYCYLQYLLTRKKQLKDKPI